MFSRPLWAEIDLSALKHNIRRIKDITGSDKRIMAVVKGNAYGHGAPEVARTLQEEGISDFAVAFLEEALVLRQAGISDPILILGWTPAEDFPAAVKHQLTLCLYDLEEARILNQMAAKEDTCINVHLKIDTGMTRIGFLPNEKSLRDISEIVSLSNIRVEGIFTHLSRADEKNKEYALMQLKRFTEFIAEIEARTSYVIPVRHAANSASVLSLPEAHFDMVRAGIILYGLSPSKEICFSDYHFKPVLSLKARLSRVEQIPAETLISYGGRFKTDHATTIGTIPAGYADGYTRLLSDKGEIVIRGQKRPVVGSICMDQCMVILDGIDNIEKGEEVWLIGGDTLSETAEDIADKIGTITYEVVCMISSRVPRIYINEQK